ncbi:CDP-glycerol glycerophosphotransferase family protein [Halorussus marinus]|uniref:CDP-glycerol glycerophosphotransferase family protein n=1 Tax=Halorussus marinus TaxID=2505976 RepID=UPI0010920CD9|nr:CDP-glycerol glycerophosphotransferase family protein [Halorussus marinus]
MDVRALRERALAVADHLSFLAQWMLYVAVSALSPLWERDDRLWAFGARGGEAFADNSKYLFLRVAADHPDIRPVWLSKDRAVVAELRRAGYEAYHCYSLRGLAVNLRAGAVFLTQGHRDLAMPCCAGALTVLLWHGIPLKHVSWDAGFADAPAPVRAGHAAMARAFDLLTVPGDGTIRPFESGLGVARPKMVATGYPRNDALLGSIPGEDLGTDAAALARVRSIAADHRVVCYLPTYREWDPGAIAANVDFEALEEFLAEREAYLVVKPHPKESLDLPEGLSRVVALPEPTDVYPLLRAVDALVTDYSSVYFDFLLRNRPVAFYAFDLDRYRAERGFYFDYEAVTPGPVARTFPELLAALDRTLDAAAAGPDADPDATRRRALGEALFERSDPDYCRADAVYRVVRRRLAASNAS